MEYQIVLPLWFKLKSMVAVLLGFLCGVFLITIGSVVHTILGVLSLVICVPLAVFSMPYLFTRSYLCIDRNGITYQMPPLKLGLIPWDDILYVDVTEEKQFVSVWLRMKNYNAFIRRYRGVMRLFLWPENKYIKFSHQIRFALPRKSCDQDALRLALKCYGHGKEWPSQPFPL